MLLPKLIEKENDFQCKFKHSQTIESVNLDQNIQRNERFICKACQNISQVNSRIVEYNFLKQFIHNQQNERIKKTEIIIQPHIIFVKQLSEALATTRIKLIRQLDFLLLLSQNQIITLLKIMENYGILNSQGGFTQQKEQIIKQRELIEKIKQNHKDWRQKITLELEQFQIHPEHKLFQMILDNLEKLTTFQESLLISQSNDIAILLELLINPYINFVQFFKEKIAALKTRLIQLVDNFIWLTEDWINVLVDSIISYSFLDELDNLIQQKEPIIDSAQLISKIKTIHQDWKMKINLKLKQLKPYSEFKKCQQSIDNLDQLTNEQEQQFQSNSIIKLSENSFISNFQQYIRNSQSQEVLIIEDIIYIKQQGIYHPQKKLFSIQKKENLIIYTSNEGEVIRIDQAIQQKEFLKKWEQIVNLQWIGQYGYNNEKIGKWTATWEGEKISDLGGEYKDGKKQGQWIELFSNYWSQAKAFEIGEYISEKRFGIWKFKYRDQEIGGGEYNEFGLRFGKWIELWEGFWDQALVTYQGQYNQNSQKIGRWDVMYDGNGYGKYKKIGGGLYDQEGKQKKIGRWVELFEEFRDSKQVTYNGDYNMNIKVGRWDIMYCQPFRDNKQIGGGSYDQDGNQKKIGQWVELDEGFYFDKQVTYNGQYNMNGMKVGKWDILYCKWGEQEYQQIGGGSYDQEGNLTKIGKWVELDQGFYYSQHQSKQVTYDGEYNMNGMKVGRWDIMYCEWGKQEYKKILQKYVYGCIFSGGGSYHQNGDQKKVGKWIELDESFQLHNQVTQNGQYNLNGRKVGRWDFVYFKFADKEYKQIGGGSYDQVGCQRKIGSWVELDDGFGLFKQVTYKGEYNLNGRKVGRWDIMYFKFADKEYKQMDYSGGGSYDQVGSQKKIGKWVELDEGYYYSKQVTYNGYYNQNGRKIGKWDIMYCKREEKEYKQIGSGEYDQKGDQIKVGKWIELDDGFYRDKQLIYCGEYNQIGKKVGTWVEMDLVDNKKRGIKQYYN